MFKLFDKDENYISSVENVTSARHIEEINGEDTLELSLIEKELTESEKAKEVDKLYGLPEGTMESAGRNLLKNSGVETTNNKYRIKSYTPCEWLVEGETYTVTLCVTPAEGVFSFNPYLSGGYTRQCAMVVNGTDKQVLTETFTARYKSDRLPEDNPSYAVLDFFRFPNDETVTEPSTIHWCKLEKGSTATPWTPAPEDVNIKFQETIEKGYKIAHKTEYGHWKEFVVKEVEEMHATEGIEKSIYCESSFYETIGDYIEDKRPSGTANSALAVALEPTRWEVGIVDNLGVNATNFYQISAKEAVQKIAEAWEAEIQTRVTVVGNKITHRYVDLLKKRGGDYGKRFTYSKNLESVSKIVHRDDVITALYGYGKGEEVGDGYGRRIDFADINNGKAYVENNEAKEIWGRNNPDGTKSHVFSRVYFDDVEEKDLLLSLTQKKLEEASQPLITYQCSVGLEDVGLGDNVRIIDTEFNPELRLNARVVKINRDLLEKDKSVITLGNFIPNIIDSLAEQERYISNFRSKEGVYDRADVINADGTIDAQFLNNLVDELNLKMNSQGGYVFVSEDGKGLITTNAPTIAESTMAIQLVGGGFRIANSKLPNGNFNWRTFGDGDGFIADLIVAGALQGGKVKFDLTNGTFLIGESTEDYLIYFDGTNLNFAQGREYTWEDIDADNKTWNDIDADNKTWLEVIRSPLYNPYQLTHDLGALESDFGRTLSLISDEETLDLMERAIGGKTLIKGGYINTQLVAAQSILANMIKVNDLSAISANIGTVIAGLLKSANGESYFDLTNNRLVTNSGNIGGFNITNNSLTVTFNKIFGPFTQADVDRVQGILLGDITPSQTDYNKYDFGGKGYLNIVDLAEVNKMVLSVKPNPQTITYTLSLNTSDMREMIKLESSIGRTLIGAGGINTKGGKFERIDAKEVSAKSFVDATPFYKGNALEELKKVSDDGTGNIDHSTLPEFAQVEIKADVKQGNNLNETKNGRDIGAMVSVLTKAVQELVEKNEEQDILINELQRNLKNKNASNIKPKGGQEE